MEHLLFKATLAAAVFTFFIILFTRKENSYLGTSATPGNKKLMVVDQTSGAISFLNDSVEGVNQKFLQNDATQAALLIQLFGPELDGAGGTFKTKMDELLAADGPIASTYETKALANSRLSSLEGSIGNCVKDGASISISSDSQLNSSHGNDKSKSEIGHLTNLAPSNHNYNNASLWGTFGGASRKMKIHTTGTTTY